MKSTAVKVEDTEEPNAIVKIQHHAAHAPVNVSLLEGPTIPFDDSQASLTSFPPGCSVLHVDSTKQPPSTTLGVVESVSFHVATKELLYKVVPQDLLLTSKDSITALEAQLLFAPLCTVEVEFATEFETTTKMGTVLNCYHPKNAPEALYSIQEDSGSLLHGISKAYVKYKPINYLASVEPSSEHMSTPTPTPPGADKIPPTPNNSVKSNVHELAKETGKRRTGNSPRVLTPPKAEEILPTPTNSVKNNVLEPTKETGKRPAGTTTDTRNMHRLETTYYSEKPLPKRAKLLNRWTPRPDVGTSHNDSSFDSSQRASVHDNLSLKADQINGDCEESQVHEARYKIPTTVFSARTIKEFFRTQGSRLMEVANCDMKLNGGNKNDDCERSMHIQLTGTKRSTESAMHILEESLVNMVHPHDKGRALYHLALVNEHRIKTKINSRERRIVFQYCYHQDKKPKRYILCRCLPKDILVSGAIGFVIGQRGKKKRDLMKRFNCEIEINSERSPPHYTIYGSDAGAIEGCSREIERLLLEGAQYKGQSRHRRISM